jgi:hypothetical protein
VYDDHCSAGLIDRHDLGVTDGQSTAVRKVDVKWLKRPRLVHDSQLLDGHDDILSGRACVSKQVESIAATQSSESASSGACAARRAGFNPDCLRRNGWQKRLPTARESLTSSQAQDNLSL